MPTIDDILTFVSRSANRPVHEEEGVRHSTASRGVTGVTVCWMATPDAIEATGAAGHELLIGHESLYFPYNAYDPASPPAGWYDWPVNRQRRALLDRYGLTFVRMHGLLDTLCILDVFADLLGLGAAVYADGYTQVYEIAPCTVGELAVRVKTATGMTAVRVSPAAGLETVVHRVGLPWGGMGLFVNVGYQQELIEQGCDVFIAGESDNYGFHFAAECGIPMIETSHEICENPGLRRFAEILAAQFLNLDVRFYENTCTWQMM
jgi:putative NIF3 family GTP cyclohydrolase 1 type 2